MQAYSNEKKVGSITQAMWRPLGDQAVAGTLIFDSYDPPSGEDLVIYSEKDGRMGKQIFTSFQSTAITSFFDQVSISFIAKSVSEWKPLGI